MNPTPFADGDLVGLRSGGPILVASVRPTDGPSLVPSTRCFWHDRLGVMHERVVPNALLESRTL